MVPPRAGLGFPRQRRCRGGTGSQLAPQLPVTAKACLGAPIEPSRAAVAQQTAPGARGDTAGAGPRRGRAEAGALVRLLRSPRAATWCSEAGVRLPDLHAPRLTAPRTQCCRGPGRARAEATDSRYLAFAKPECRWGRQEPGRSGGLWRHLPRKPRRKCGSPGGACRGFFRVAQTPLSARAISPNALKYPQKCRW